MSFAWVGPVVSYLGKGTAVTVWVSLLSVFFATLLGLLVGIGVAGDNRWVKRLVRAYIDLFRGIPSLIILLFVFFALPQVGLATGPIAACVIGLALWGSANVAETVRGAIASIPRHQEVAARALGMGKLAALLHVVMPQAFRRLLPPYISQITVLVQASALTSIVGVTDVLGAARQMIERLAYSGNSHSIAIYAMVLAVFFAICYPLTWLAGFLESKLRR